MLKLALDVIMVASDFRSFRNMHQTLYFGYGKAISFFDSNGFSVTGFDIIVDGAATDPKV